MEESQKSPIGNFHQELLNLSALQEQIEQTKKEVSQLLKIQNNQHRNLQTIYQQSIHTARNKLNHLQKDEHKHNLQAIQSNRLLSKQEQVKQMRERQEQDLKEVKDMLRKSREKERSIIRDNSLRYDQTIKKNRLLEKEIKEKLVRDMKKEKENYKHSLAQSRLQQSKQKEVELFQRTLAKIERRPHLQRELERINREKQMIQKRVEGSKQLQNKFAGEVNKIRRMKLEEVREMVKGQTEGDPELRLTRCVKSLQSLDSLKTTLLQKQPDLKLDI